MSIAGDLPATTVALLLVIAFVGGVGISSVGPGGVLPTIGLFVLTPLDPAAVAGTAIVAHVGTGLVGSAVYLRSGHLRDGSVRRTGMVLATAAIVGTPVGVLVNEHVSSRFFGGTLAVFSVTAAVMIVRRQLRRTDGAAIGEGRGPATVTGAAPRFTVLVGIGAIVAGASGVAGLGGPMLAVPVLAVLGYAMVDALAAAQVQSIVIAAVGTIGYAVAGAIDWPLAVIVGVPQVIGVVGGWRIARTASQRVLAGALIAVLLGLAPYLALRG